jgi:sulfide:quinone oxidoreductase
MSRLPINPPAHVVIAGGGFAALETAVALRALAENRVRLSVIAPETLFRYRPAATLEAFGGDPPLSYDLPTLIGGLEGVYHRDRLAAVISRLRSVKLQSGRQLSYDYLVLAIGAESRPAIPGALTFRDQRDLTGLREEIDRGTRGELRRLLFAVPSLHSWSLPAYELALLSATRFGEGGPQIRVVSAERRPLDVFGDEGSAIVGDLLTHHDIRFLGGVAPRRVSRGRLELDFNAPLRADAVIAVPELRGRRIAGVPARWLGFIPTDHIGRVEGIDDVFAVGDSTTFPIKQGGLAVQQADLVAHTIASQLGAPVHEFRPSRVLQARLLGGGHPLLLRTELDAFGHPAAPTIERYEYGQAPPAAKVQARYLGPYLDRHEPAGMLSVA